MRAMTEPKVVVGAQIKREQRPRLEYLTAEDDCKHLFSARNV